MNRIGIQILFPVLAAVLAAQATADDVQASDAEPAEMLADIRPPADGEAVTFVLRDQFRDEIDYRLPQEKVHVVFITDRHSGYATVDWYLRFEETFEDRIDYFGIGALDEIPALMRPLVRPFLRRRVEQPILLDWRNEVCDAWRCEERTPNIYLVHPDGTIGAHITGKICDRAFEKIAAIVEDMLAAAGTADEARAD